MRRSATRLDERRAERTATSERITSGRNRDRDDHYREKDDHYREKSRRDDKEKSTSSSSSSSSSSARRSGSSRTDVNPIPKPKHDAKLEWVEKQARRRAKEENDSIDNCVDRILREQERNEAKNRPLWDWSTQRIKDWCKKESGGDADRERRLWDRYK
ncbi:predicted protein [Sclerotinia sclerotiorum 1980 UF-70]|uniref:Uncharacterized protein n=2 Tax=Sclerotinia sclerotiorum (strain ATCC 18683 / 1980 / Ss-1) TaxID=665079 RepID=A7EEY6_SCLS1|nr:predicted protein [Sclerotinia sclerotiorum 1980 UF-70]APA12507.1 hypothetical protein sscle_09g072770 [Sclerotinia sclerotiorum 1980 UF-70]EDO01402.1 predicted protein [Sclerotinia sclerotiorum 1980 UF-70]